VGLLVDATTNEQIACLFANCFYSGLRRLFLRNGTNDFNQDGHYGSLLRTKLRSTRILLFPPCSQHFLGKDCRDRLADLEANFDIDASPHLRQHSLPYEV